MSHLDYEKWTHPSLLIQSIFNNNFFSSKASVLITLSGFQCFIPRGFNNKINPIEKQVNIFLYFAFVLVCLLHVLYIHFDLEIIDKLNVISIGESVMCY